MAGARQEQSVDIARRQFVAEVTKVFVGSALMGHGLGHIIEGALTEPRRKNRARAELKAQGITEPSVEFDRRHKKLIEEKSIEDGHSHLRDSIDFGESIGGAYLAGKGTKNLYELFDYLNVKRGGRPAQNEGTHGGKA